MKTLSTQNISCSALETLFGVIDSIFYLKDSGGMHIFADDQGIFPTLEEFGIYDVQVMPDRKRSYQSNSDNSSDDDLMVSYKQASTAKKTGKNTRKSSKRTSKGKGPMKLPSTSGNNDNTWFFKIAIGEWLPASKKINAVKNCLIKCSESTTYWTVREEVAKQMNVAPGTINLYDSDYLKIEDCSGRVGKFHFLNNF